MRAKLLLFLGVALGLVVSGCSKSEGPTDFDTDEAYIQSAVTTIDSIVQFSESERDVLDDDGAKEFEYQEGFGKVADPMSPITPLRWGRRIASVSRNINVVIQGDTLAIATIARTFAGTLFIVAIRDTGGGPDTVLVTKPFSNTATRKIIFVRVARFARRHLNWRPIAISLVDGRSPTNDFDITRLRIITPRDTFIVTDPLNTWIRFGRMRGEMPYVYPGDSVQVQVMVSSQNDSSELMVLRWGVGWGDGRRHRARIPLVQQSGVPGNYTRVYERTFVAHLHVGRFNAVIDGLSYNTLFDDVAPYSNKFWGLPYICTLF